MRFFTVFALIALAEMATFFWVESRIGLGWALGLALMTALVGSVLVRRAGVSVLGRIQARLGQGQLPGRELSDGAAVLVSGAFLISPGFITDVLGFLLLVPAIRGLVYRIISKRFSTRFTVVDASGQTTGEREDVIDVDGWE
ncbi:MAG: FxsA family protein [Actinomycetota bacterium]|nr:FxsA family protein [Actinomycetota bacterium]